MAMIKQSGWIVAVLLAAALFGVVLWQVVGDDDDGRRAGALGGEVSSDQEQLLKQKKDYLDNPEKAPKGEGPRIGAPDRVHCSFDDPPNVFIEWRFEPQTVDELKKKAKHIVLGEVTEVTPGADFVVPVEGEPGGEDRTPTLIVKLKVEKSYKGSKKAGSEATVYQLGGPCFRPIDDPAYKKGEKHLLFAHEDPQGRLRTVSPEGRYEEGDDGTLDPVTDSPVAKKIKGKKAKDLEAELTG